MTRHRTLAALAAAAILALTGCSAGSSNDSADNSAGGTADLSTTEEAPAAAPASRDEQPAATQAVISTGTVTVRSDDVAQARADVQALVERYAGTIADEQSSTDEDGDLDSSHLVLRIPAADFDAVMTALAETGELVSSARTAEDVTTQVIDTGVKVRSQRRSIERIQQLLDQATSIEDVVRIEQELANRQSALDSLEQQQAWLADQTTLSTVEVSLRRTTSEPPPEASDAGFLAGLSAGWTGLVAVALVFVTVLGAVLPFAVLLALVGVPLYVWLRRRARRSARTPSAA